MSHLDEGVLHALLDGEIPSAELPPIQAHLAACAACRARLEEERQLLAESDDLVELLEVPAEGTVPAGARHSRTPRRAWGRTLAWAASLLAAVGLGYAGHALMQPGSGLEIAANPAAAPRGTDTAPDVSAGQPLIRPQTVTTVDSVRAPAGAAPGNLASRRPAAKAAEAKQEVAAAATSRGDSGAFRSEAQPAPATPPPSVAEAAAPLRDQALRLDERRANPALGLGAVKLTLAPAETIQLADAIRRLGGSLRLIEGLVPLRLEAQGPYVRVVYPSAQGELVLQQQLIDGRVAHTLLAPTGFPIDSLARLRARVRE